MLHWWGRELFALVPTGVRDWLRDGSVATAVVGAADLRDLPAESNGIPRAPKRAARLVLSAGLSLYREVTLPAAAEENLSEVLGFEMDRFTPFKSDEVTFDYAVLERDVARKQVRIALLIVPRGLVRRALEVSRFQGWRPVSVFVAGHANAKAFVRRHRLRGVIPNQRAWWPPSWGFVGVLALLTFVLAAVALYTPLELKEAQLARLDIEIEEARARAAVVTNLEKSIEASLSTASAVIERKYALPPPVETLAELTRLLPDDTWLGSFALQSNRLLISGLSQNATALLEPLERAALFEQVRFASPVISDEGQDAEHFAIEMAVAGRGQ